MTDSPAQERAAPRKPLNLKPSARKGATAADALCFAREPDAAPPPARDEAKPWTILVVDDDPQVHAVTRLVLSRLRYRDRGVRILSAHSAAEGQALLAAQPDVAVVLLDVVMESDDAGLKLAHRIRTELGNEAVRIILRTGQPGQAPEERVILDYDINDYKAKTELTAQKLFTTVVTALRSYGHITALEANRRGLGKILDSSATLFRLHSMQDFATGVLMQLSAFLGCAPNGILCVQHGGVQENGLGNHLRLLAGVGAFEGCPECLRAHDCLNGQSQDLLRRALEARESQFEAHLTALFIDTRGTDGTAVLIHADEPVSAVDRQLLALFAAKISLGFENVLLYENLEAMVVQRTQALEQANRELSRLATTDSLTGAHNRRSFLAHAAAHARHARSSGQPLSFLALDIDHFKAINDTHGHDGGDAALRAFVVTAGEALRPGDVIGRMGGEEFAVLLPDTALADAAQVAERLRAAMEALTVEVEADGTGIRFTVSAGLAGLDADGATPEAVLTAADRRLYRAKSGGRNRVEAG